jgi:class 3 adenylate cyclase
MFIDLVGFSLLANRVSSDHLVELLNAFFNHANKSAADDIVEKAKTVGGANLAITGAI